MIQLLVFYQIASETANFYTKISKEHEKDDNPSGQQTSLMSCVAQF